LTFLKKYVIIYIENKKRMFFKIREGECVYDGNE
jgi:hypothetical protein